LDMWLGLILSPNPISGIDINTVLLLPIIHCMCDEAGLAAVKGRKSLSHSARSSANTLRC